MLNRTPNGLFKLFRFKCPIYVFFKIHGHRTAGFIRRHRLFRTLSYRPFIFIFLLWIVVHRVVLNKLFSLCLFTSGLTFYFSGRETFHVGFVHAHNGHGWHQLL